MDPLIPADYIAQRIYLVRSRKVMFDSDLAILYGVKTKELNKAVKRNPARFPPDFMLRLTAPEARSLRFQIGTSKVGRGGRRYLPNAFTEEGVAMLSTVLHSERAIQVNITIMRIFVRLRQLLSTHRKLAERLMAHEYRLDTHDRSIRSLYKAIRRLLKPPLKPRKPIGFKTPD
jgi:hypothetical protein